MLLKLQSVPPDFTKLNSFVDIFKEKVKKSYETEQLFDKRLSLQNTLHRMLLTFGFCSHKVKAKSLRFERLVFFFSSFCSVC